MRNCTTHHNRVLGALYSGSDIAAVAQRDRTRDEEHKEASSACRRFQPLTYRPELPLTRWQKWLRAVGIPVTAKRGAPVQLTWDRDCTASAVYFLGPGGPYQLTSRGASPLWEHAEPEA